MSWLKYIIYVIPALTFIADLIKAADDGKVTGQEVFDAAKKACKTLGLDIGLK